jgi:dihydroorotase
MNALVAAARPPAELLLRGPHVLDPLAGIDGPHDVLVRDGEIAALGAPASLEAPAGAQIVEAEGKHLFAAFVDPHVHLRSPGQEHKEDLETGTRAAAAGGYCAVVAMPNTDPVLDQPALLRGLLMAAARDARIPVGFMAAISVGLRGEQLTEMSELREVGALGFTDDGKPVANAGLLRHALRYQLLCGGVLALHEEDPALSGSGVMHEGMVSTELGLAGIPSISESTMIARDALIAEHEHGRVHFQHLSTRRSIDALAAARVRGVNVSGEVTPHHLLLTEEAVRPLDSSFKMNPPLRTEEDRLALIEALRDGTIECIATDHAPHAPELKDLAFDEAPAGMLGLEHAASLTYEALGGERCDPVRFFDLLSRTPARIAQLRSVDQRVRHGAHGGALAVGDDANLVVFDPASRWTVDRHTMQSRSTNTPYDNRAMLGRVRSTLAKGQLVVDHGVLT